MMIEIKAPRIITEESPPIMEQEGIKRVEGEVLEILEKNDFACRDDVVLLFEYWKKTGQVEIKKISGKTAIILNRKTNTLTKPETISRIRRKLHKDGRIFYDKETEVKREKHRQNYQDNYGRKNEFATPIDNLF